MSAEASLIAAVLVDPERYWDCSVRGSDFTDPDLAAIWQTIGAMLKQGQSVDVTTVAEKGFPFHELAEIAGGPGAPSNAAEYARIIRQGSLRRQMRANLRETDKRLQEPNADVLEVAAEHRVAFDAIDGTGERAADSRDAMRRVMRELRDRQAMRDEFGAAGIPTGITALHQTIAGWMPGNFYVLAGSPGSGKSSLAFRCAVNAAEMGVPVGYFSAEMPVAELFGREVARRMGLNTRDLDRPESIDRIPRDERVRELAKLPIRADDSTRRLPEILSGFASMARSGCRVVFFDHIGLIRSVMHSESRVRELGAITQELRYAAMRLNIAVVGLYQLNRNHANEKRPPAMHDLRGSGEIEENATHILLLHCLNPDETVRRIDLIVGKNRHGPRGVFDQPMEFDPRTQEWT